MTAREASVLATNPVERAAASNLELARSRTRCDVCDVRIQGSSGHCRTHKFAIRRAGERLRSEGLILDYVGKAWWIWDARGDVLVLGQPNRAKALALLDLGASDFEAEEVEEES